MCFATMGVHYLNFGYDENADICEELTPFQLMYIDNKLNGLENKKTSEQKQQVKVSTKKVKKPRDSEKVKKEARERNTCKLQL